MRKRNESEGISLHVIAGTHVVLLCLNASEKAREGLLGFLLSRKDVNTGRHKHLSGFKEFEKDGKDSDINLVQAFLWGDYNAEPNTEYEYAAIPVYGSPQDQQHGTQITVTITTEDPESGTHGVFFNRGTVGQAYARKFDNKNPDKVPNHEAYRWLSRGLEEAMLGFIGKAENKDYGLRVAAYEFDYVPVIQALYDASERGADVKILYDRSKRGPWENTDKAIANVPGVEKLMIPRSANSSIKHNKYIVLLHKGKPVQVLMGSTNFTKGGIFGQSNVVHIVRDETIAEDYFKYWTRCSKNPEMKELRPLNQEFSPTPEGEAKVGITPIFSPRPDLSALNFYGNLMVNANESLGFTAAFGVNEELAQALDDKELDGSELKNPKEPRPLRYVLLEHEGNTYDEFKDNKNNKIALGTVLTDEEIKEEHLTGWEAEHLTGLNDHVKYLHTKYLFVDPLTDDPILVTGSANFSTASTKNNDENMIIIRGNTNVVDIYLTEFTRLFNHFEFRDQMAQHGRGEDNDQFSDFLVPDDSWSKLCYEEGTHHARERELFK